MKFKLEFTFDISDSSLLIDANDGRSEEYTSLEDVPEDTLMDVVYNYLDGVIEGITYDQIVRILALLLWTSWVRTYYVLGETTILVKSECLFSVEEL